MRTRQPDDFNGYGYFFVRLCCTGLGFQANIVEEYGLELPFSVVVTASVIHGILA